MMGLFCSTLAFDLLYQDSQPNKRQAYATELNERPIIEKPAGILWMK